MPYLWFAGVKSKVAFTPPIGSASTIDATTRTSFSELISDLQFGFMGAAEVRRGKFSAQTDIVYMDVEDSGSAVRGVNGPRGREVPISTGGKLELKTTLWTLSGGYDVFRNARNFVQLFSGFRYYGSNVRLDWQFQGPIADLGRTGTVKASDHVWDALGGLRGESALGDSRWKLVYYGDLGAGDSKLTWQASGQLAYAERWGDIGVGWRYIEYKSRHSPLQSLKMSGPILIGHYRFGS